MWCDGDCRAGEGRQERRRSVAMRVKRCRLGRTRRRMLGARFWKVSERPVRLGRELPSQSSLQMQVLLRQRPALTTGLQNHRSLSLHATRLRQASRRRLSQSSACGRRARANNHSSKRLLYDRPRPHGMETEAMTKRLLRVWFRSCCRLLQSSRSTRLWIGCLNWLFD